MTTVRIIGVPMDLGASRRGVDMGPSAVRYTDLRDRIEKLGIQVADTGNVSVPFREDAAKGAQRGARYLGAITDVCTDVATRTALEAGTSPSLGRPCPVGQHRLQRRLALAASVTLGVVCRTHGDLNTPASSLE
jgi:arginase